jgi:AbrB family looped-hinge helix DNA binding protein
MNAQAPIRQFTSRLTSKCQVTIPKEIRDALGLKAGDRVAFELTPDGDARILPVSRADELAARRERIAKGVREAREIYKAQGLPLGMSNAEFFDMMRGSPAEK